MTNTNFHGYTPKDKDRGKRKYNSKIHLDVYVPRNIAQCFERYIHCHVKKRQTRQSPTPKEEQLAYPSFRFSFQTSLTSTIEMTDFIHYVLRLFHMTLNKAFTFTCGSTQSDKTKTNYDIAWTIQVTGRFTTP